MLRTVMIRSDHVLIFDFHRCNKKFVIIDFNRLIDESIDKYQVLLSIIDQSITFSMIDFYRLDTP